MTTPTPADTVAIHDSVTPADYRAERERVRGLLEGTTEGEWYWRENDRMMQLFARRIWPWPEHYPDDLKEFAPEGMELHPLQILKAPKTGTPYAEYWPAEKDAALIAQSPTLAQAYAALCGKHAALLEGLEGLAGRWAATGRSGNTRTHMLHEALAGQLRARLPAPPQPEQEGK